MEAAKPLLLFFFFAFLSGLWVSLLLHFVNAQQLWLQPGGGRGV